MVIDPSIVNTLLEVLKLKSESLYYHSNHVAEVAKVLGSTIGCSDRECEILQTAGYLHDIGKLGVKDSILFKTEALTRKEWEQIKLHPIMSIDILRNIGECENEDIFKTILYHHENTDGSGYFGLKMKEIPLLAKILRVADVFSAMSMDRPYKTAYPVEVSAAYASGLFTFDIQRKDIKEVLNRYKKHKSITITKEIEVTF